MYNHNIYKDMYLLLSYKINRSIEINIVSK